MSTAPIAFTGVSTYSNDLQSILSRAVSIAQLPVTSLQNRQSDNTQKIQLLGTLNSAVSSLAASINVLGTLGSNKGMTATSSDPATVYASSTGASSPTTYTISNIQSVATAASETSTSGYADSAHTPIIDSSGNTLDLLVGKTHYTITLKTGENNLLGLVNEINSSGAPVTASILTTGTGANGNYLCLTANNTGATTLQLTGTPPGGTSTDLITGFANAGSQGSDAIFDLNEVPVDRPTNNINDVISGVTLTLLAKPANNASVRVTLGSDTSQLSSALSDLATKYNAVVDQVDAQTGQNAGLLGGDMMIRQTLDDLRQFTSYQGPNNMSLATLGITFDTSGKMTFDSSGLSSLSSSQVTDAFNYLGSSTSGLGGLARAFTQLSDPISGLIKVESDGLITENTSLTDQINALNTRISTMQNALTLQLEAADAALAGLESQQNVLNASVQAVNLALYGKNYGTATSG